MGHGCCPDAHVCLSCRRRGPRSLCCWTRVSLHEEAWSTVTVLLDTGTQRPRRGVGQGHSPDAHRQSESLGTWVLVTVLLRAGCQHPRGVGRASPSTAWRLRQARSCPDDPPESARAVRVSCCKFCTRRPRSLAAAACWCIVVLAPAHALLKHLRVEVMWSRQGQPALEHGE